MDNLKTYPIKKRLVFRGKKQIKYKYLPNLAVIKTLRTNDSKRI